MGANLMRAVPGREQRSRWGCGGLEKLVAARGQAAVRRGGLGRRLILGGCALLCSVAGVPPTQAQTHDQELSLHRFAPAPGPRNLIVTRGARTDGQMAYSAGLVVAYAHKPFSVTHCTGGGTACSDSDLIETQVVSHLATGDVVATVSPWPRLQLGGRVPIAFTEGEGLRSDGAPDPEGVSGLGLADPEVEAKVRLLGRVKDAQVLGAALVLTVPLGASSLGGKFVSEGGVTLGLRGIGDWRAGAWSFVANVTPTLRDNARIGTTRLGNELRYSAGAAYRLSDAWRVVFDGFGATRFSGDAGSTVFEVNGALGFQFPDSPWAFQAGGGMSPVPGVGGPLFRGFLGIAYVVEEADRDGDGVVDRVDRCPDDAEDHDGDADLDGCPDLDQDGDGIVEPQDRCPLEPEDIDGFEDEDGCPDPDNDGDGLLDDRDRCPNEPETFNGYQDHDGCPDKPDSDNDGVLDHVDKCPSEPEDIDGVEDEDGCPE